MTKSSASRVAAISILGILAWSQPCLAQIHVPADYATIQQAVDAATSGMTITVAAGQYEEQVLIEGKDLTLLGDPGAIIVSPARLDEVGLGGPAAQPRRPVLAVTLCNVDMDGFAFDGLRRGDEIFRFTGVLYVAAGGTVSNCTFSGFRSQSLAATLSPERAFELVNPIPAGSGLVDIAVQSCSFSDNVDAIFISGDEGVNPNALRVHCDVFANVIVGLGPHPTTTQTGIRVSAGTRGIIHGNQVSAHEYVGAGAFSIAIYTGANEFGPDFVALRLQIVGNTVANNTVGLLSLFADRNQIVNNIVTSGPFGFSGIAVSGVGNKITNNSIYMDQSVVPGNSGVGLLGAEFDAGFATGYAIDTAVIANTISGADLPVWFQTGVTGTRMKANTILP